MKKMVKNVYNRRDGKRRDGDENAVNYRGFVFSRLYKGFDYFFSHILTSDKGKRTSEGLSYRLRGCENPPPSSGAFNFTWQPHFASRPSLDAALYVAPLT